ncbi:hypothetical protein CkaCkLH20_13280 [Colletotrichum karsti]|uniref:Uncharacterized protein n=1 Tax=Colletotrichum karsti TaxID=1095194 RepID=A0A9P6HRT8_9PEZI|nr:uncharacterized protein CkaCkLH20_13280 [Colletotrichum karsti]KAF9869247.1 hypothetical protein CkaCkLH20_13280 [Colletotrichum karsti]
MGPSRSACGKDQPSTPSSLATKNIPTALRVPRFPLQQLAARHRRQPPKAPNCRLANALTSTPPVIEKVTGAAKVGRKETEPNIANIAPKAPAPRPTARPTSSHAALLRETVASY